jgi:quercetin dioxygenase-like cupin family protein
LATAARPGLDCRETVPGSAAELHHATLWAAIEAAILAVLDWSSQDALADTTQGRASMNRLIIPALLVATGVVVTTAWSQPVTLSLLNKRYFTMPLENDPTREVGLQSVLLPPGGGNEFHRHPGDQWTAIQEGEITYTVRGQPPQVLKAGDSNYVPRGTIHRQQNLSDKPARYIEMRIFDKGKPPSEVMKD